MHKWQAINNLYAHGQISCILHEKINNNSNKLVYKSKNAEHSALAHKVDSGGGTVCIIVE